MFGLRAFFCLPLFLPPGPSRGYARFTAFCFFYCPDRDCPTRVLLPSAFSTARTGTALRAFYCLPLFLLPGTGSAYARFHDFRLFYCPERARPTRVFLPSAFSTARTGLGPTRVFMTSPFSTARTGPTLRAFFCFPLFLPPGPGRGYARFSAFCFFYCPERARPTRVFLLSAFSTARTGPALRAFSCLSPFLPPGLGRDYARFSVFRFFYCPDQAGVTRVFLSSAFSTARTGTGPGRGPASSN